MNNIEAIEILEKMYEDYAFTSAQRDALNLAIYTIKLRIPRPPMRAKTYCATCGREVIPGRKICESCGQWIIWKDGTK